MKIYQAVAHALQEEGVEHLAGLMGDGNLRFMTYWADDLGLPCYGARHEAASVAMADGYARVTGKVAIATVTQGPGLTNTMTALVNARKAKSPIILAFGAVAAHQKGWPQDVDSEAFLTAAGVPMITLDNPSTAYSDVVKAVRLAAKTRGPVGLCMPVDLQEYEWNAWEDTTEVPHDDPQEATVDVAVVDEFATELAAAKRPVIIAGRGAVEAGVVEELRRVGNRVGALFATTLRGKSAFGDDPYSVGVIGGLGTNLSTSLIGEADTVLVVGAGLNDFTMMRGSLLAPKARVLRIDISAASERSDIDQSLLVSDAAIAVPALLKALESRGIEQIGYRERADERLRGYFPASEFKPIHEADAVDPRAFAVKIDEVMPRDRTVVTDAGHFFGYPIAYVDAPDGRSFICGIDFGSIGLGIGLAMGAHIATPDRPTALFIGDGGLLMSLSDLETAIRYRFPIAVFVFNDAAYGSELQIIRMWGLSEEMSVFPPTDFAQLARDFGAQGHTVSTEEDLNRLGETLGDLTNLDGVVLVDCKISREVMASWLVEAFDKQ